MTVTIEVKDEEERKQLTDMVENFGPLLSNSMIYAGLIAVLRRNEPQFILGDDEYKMLDKICLIYNNCSADYVNIGWEIHKSITTQTASDVPRFIAMLKERSINPSLCADLFSDWASGEGLGQMSIDCMEIQSKQHTDMTEVYKWIVDNEPTPGTDWKTEIKLYEKEVY